jgi:CheY-like chemotaxis protein
MPSILLVDDSEVARRAVAQRLRAVGFDVHEAASAAAARGVPLDPLVCAIVDVDLDDGDGPTLAAELRAARPGLPIAFFTAGATAELADRARAYGPVFSKPDLEPLLAWVRGVGTQPPPTK